MWEGIGFDRVYSLYQKLCTRSRPGMYSSSSFLWLVETLFQWHPQNSCPEEWHVAWDGPKVHPNILWLSLPKTARYGRCVGIRLVIWKSSTGFLRMVHFQHLWRDFRCIAFCCPGWFDSAFGAIWGDKMLYLPRGYYFVAKADEKEVHLSTLEKVIVHINLVNHRKLTMFDSRYEIFFI